MPSFDKNTLFKKQYLDDNEPGNSEELESEEPQLLRAPDSDDEGQQQFPPQVEKRRRFSSIPSMAEQREVSRILSGVEINPDDPVPPMGGGRPLPPALPEVSAYEVDFDGPDDPIHPYNWPVGRKMGIASALASCSLVSTWCSSIFSVATLTIAQKFHVRPVVASLGVALYVMGFASGPIVWSPLSEVYGRKFPIVLSMFMFTCFVFATATAENLQTLIICRFFTGFSGSAPLTVVAAAFADMFDSTSRGIAIDIFAVTVFCGPVLAPIVGGFIVESYLGWRWTLYLTGIMSGVTFLVTMFFMHETYPPIILVSKAETIRKLTGNWAVHAPHEVVKIDFGDIISKTLARPLKMLISEPIILLVSLYNGFCYTILYLCLSSYPYAFGVKYHWELRHATLPYIGLLIGMIICGLVMMLYYEKKYDKIMQANGGRPVAEARLEPMKPAAFIFSIGLFWFFWTANYPQKVHWMVPTASGLFTGYGLMGLFVPSMNYVVDAYLFFAASALAALTFLRSGMAAAAPLFATYMFSNMGFNWSGLLLGGLALLMAPVPFLFSWYGKRLRAKSKFAFK